MPSARSICAREGNRSFIWGSPPEKTTQRTPSSRNEASCCSRAAGVISFGSRIRQMSHITQRQLHWLCGEITATGMVRIWCAARSEASLPVDLRATEMDTRVLIIATQDFHDGIPAGYGRQPRACRGSGPRVNRLAYSNRIDLETDLPKFRGSSAAPKHQSL